MNTLENNKLIAEFMDFEVFDLDLKTPYVDLYPKQSEQPIPMLEYCFNDWNELMLVVEKIETLGFLIHIDTIDGIKVFNPKTKDMIFVTFTAREYTSKIRETYKAVVEFIKWYNETKQ